MRSLRLCQRRSRRRSSSNPRLDSEVLLTGTLFREQPCAPYSNHLKLTQVKLTLVLSVPYPLMFPLNNSYCSYCICMFLQILEFITYYDSLMKTKSLHFVSVLSCNQRNYSNEFKKPSKFVLNCCL